MKRLTKKAIERIENSWNERPGTYQATHSLDPSDFEERSFEPYDIVANNPELLKAALSLKEKTIEKMKECIDMKKADIANLVQDKRGLGKIIADLQNQRDFYEHEYHNQACETNELFVKLAEMKTELEQKSEFDAMKADRDYFHAEYERLIDQNIETSEANKSLHEQLNICKQENRQLRADYLHEENFRVSWLGYKEMSPKELYCYAKSLKQDHDTILKDCIKLTGENENLKNMLRELAIIAWGKNINFIESKLLNDMITEGLCKALYKAREGCKRLKAEKEEIGKGFLDLLFDYEILKKENRGAIYDLNNEIRQLKQQLDITNSYVKEKEREYADLKRSILGCKEFSKWNPRNPVA